jgi:lipoprotein-anchoring transpeptidase ErfK/SrfK
VIEEHALIRTGGGPVGAKSRGRRAAVAGAWLSVLALGVSACSGSGTDTSDKAAAPKNPAKISVTLTKNPSGDVVPDKPVKISVTHGALASVTVADSKGDPIAGSLAASTGVWTPSSPFGVGQNYTLRATATASGHTGAKPNTQQTSFTVESPAESKSMLLDSITPAKGAVVGVAMPVSVVFSHPVAASARATVEKQLKVTTSPVVAGAWHWFGDRRADWRPQKFWTSGTHVTVDADLNGVNDGYGRYGVRDYQHAFTIGTDVEAVADVADHRLNVYKDGKLVRALPADAGKAGFSTWGGTMAVIDKQTEVRMTSCSVGIACDPSSPNFYDMELPWDVHLTDSGTYVHYSSGDVQPGEDNDSHGCIHLSKSNAHWFYSFVKEGDPVTVKGEPQDAAPDNGYADYNLSWSQWTA